MPDAGAANPFPGLRPYQDYEASMFFGRKDPAAEIIEKLGSQRFIAVVGTSGSGKSSIVNCGVLPTMYAGFYLPRGSRWRVVRTEPGGEPIRRLAERVGGALADRLGGESGNGQDSNRHLHSGQLEALSEAILRYGDDGLVSLVRQARLPRSDNVLVVVDQFEELFRYRDQHPSPDEAKQFVQLLLRAAEADDEHIYIMLTMRSDYLGDCMLIPGLPEAINDGIFLVPAMSRYEREQAVRGPIRVAGAAIEVPLVNRILDDVGDEMDQLPLLQHALMRTWQEWEEDARAAKEISLRYYLATVKNGAGGEADQSEATVIERALDHHAHAVYESLTSEQRDIARRIFQAITEVDELGRRGRRPRRLGPIEGHSGHGRHDLEYVTGVPQSQLAPVIEVLRATHRSFLKPEPRQELESGTVVGEDLHAGSVIDVWHESLIRNWTELKGWIDQESREAEIYTDLAKEAARDAEARELYRGAKLQTGLEWADRLLADVRADSVEKSSAWIASRRRIRGLNAVERDSLRPWASKYAESARRYAKKETQREIFDTALDFLNESRATWIRSWRRRVYAVLLVLAALVVALMRQAAHTDAAQRDNRVQVAGALDDPLERALVLAGVADQTPDSWGAAWFAGPFLRFGTDRTVLTPGGIDTLAASSLLSGFPSAALTDPGLFNLDEVLGVGFANGDSLVVFAATRETDSGPEGLVVQWPATGTRPAVVLWRSRSVQPSDIRVRSDGAVIALMDDGTIRTWPAGSTDPIEARLPSKDDPDVSGFLNSDPTGDAASFNRDGSSLAVVYDTERVVVWRFPGGSTQDTTELFMYDHLDAMDVDVSPSGDRVASADAYGGLVVFDTRADSIVWMRDQLDVDAYVPSVALDSDEGRVAWSGPDGAAYLLNLASTGSSSAGEPVELRGHRKVVTNIRFSPSGDRLLTLSADSTAAVWNVNSGDVLHTLQGHASGLNDGRFNQDGTLVVTTAADGIARLWDVGTGEEIRSLHGGGAHVLAKFGHASPNVVTIASRGGLRMWPPLDPPTLVIREEPDADEAVMSGLGDEPATDSLPVPALIPEGGQRMIRGVDQSADGRAVLVGYQKAAVLHVAGGSEPFVTPERDIEINAVALAPRTERFAVALGTDEDSETATIELWTPGADRPTELRAAGTVKALAFGPDGMRLAAAGTAVHLWDPQTRVLLEVFGDGSDDLMTSLAFSADGRYLTAATEAGDARTWRVDVRSLVATPADGPERAWPASDWRATIAEIVGSTNACLTADQRAQFLRESARFAAAAAERCRREALRTAQSQ